MPPRPHSPQAAALLASAAQHLRAGRPAGAIGPLRAALRWLPGNPAILHDLGLACLECGALEDALAALQEAVALNPRFADAHLRLGIAWEAVGQVDAALAAYRAATAVLPSLADARYRAGALLETLGKTQDAIGAFRAAAASAPRTMLGRIAAARALLLQERDAEAEKQLRQALALDRDNATALELLGNTLAAAGRFDEARPVLLRAIACDPTRAGIYYDVARCGRIGADDGALLDRMHAALALPRLEPAQRSRVHLALGKALQDLGEHEAAMQHFDAAEALRNTILRFDPDAFDSLVDSVIASFTAVLMARAEMCAASGGDPSPLLIVGLPRSGTTLVEQILSAHPAVCAGGELSFWNERGADWAANPSADGDLQGFVAASREDYRALLGSIGRGRAMVTDKMPLNILWAGLIHLAFPEATIVYCRRCPIDTALSIHQTHFNPRMAFPTGGVALVRSVRAVARLAAHWTRTLPAGRFIEIDYERLVAAPEPSIRALLAGCGLDWDAACLRPELNAGIVRTASRWQARQPIYGTAIGRWRAYEPWLGPLRALLDEPSMSSVGPQ